MSFIENIKEKAKKEIKNIVLPEGSDIRTLEAADIALKEGYASVTILGNIESINKMAQDNNLDISKATIVNPIESDKYEEYSEAFYELRKAKGMTIEQAREDAKKIWKEVQKQKAENELKGFEPSWLSRISTNEAVSWNFSSHSRNCMESVSNVLILSLRNSSCI